MPIDLTVSAIAAALGAAWKTIEQPAWNAAESAVKKAADKVVGDQISDAVSALKQRVASMLPLPTNQDLAKGVRSSYLISLQKILTFYKADTRRLPGEEQRKLGDDLAFAEVLQAWLDRRINPVSGSGVDSDTVSRADIETALGNLVWPARLDDVAQCSRMARRVAEDRALHEIENIWATSVPERFKRWFMGG